MSGQCDVLNGAFYSQCPSFSGVHVYTFLPSLKSLLRTVLLMIVQGVVSFTVSSSPGRLSIQMSKVQDHLVAIVSKGGFSLDHGGRLVE
jgi:hypothetical protein